MSSGVFTFYPSMGNTKTGIRSFGLNKSVFGAQTKHNNDKMCNNYGSASVAGTAKIA